MKLGQIFFLKRTIYVHITGIEQWKKRKGMHVEDRTLLKKYPNIFKCLAGHNVKGEQVLKVFLRGKKPSTVKEKETEILKKKEVALSEGERVEEISETLEIERWFGDLSNYQFEIVYVDTKSEEVKKKVQKIKLKERDAPAIDKSTGMKLGKIIQEHCDRIHASHSNVIGIGISKVRCVCETLVLDPCIVLYCLDKTIIPFGEKPLPEKLEEINCDIREDIVMFGMCPGFCPALPKTLPEIGCSIGIPSKISSGSVGFIVEPRDMIDPLKSGFLTASHVAVENVEELYNRGFLSQHNPDYGELNIVHPSFEDTKNNNVVGRVIESFFGSYKPEGSVDASSEDNTEGLDFALVMTYNSRKEGKISRYW